MIKVFKGWFIAICSITWIFFPDSVHLRVIVWQKSDPSEVLFVNQYGSNLWEKKTSMSHDCAQANLGR